MSDLCVHSLVLFQGSLFAAGLAGGFTHCAGMCGPFVLARMPSGMEGVPVLQRLRGAAMLPYHAGRITTYVLMAGLFAAFLSPLMVQGPMRTVVTVFLLSLAAVVFFVNAIPALTALFPWAARVRLLLPVAVKKLFERKAAGIKGTGALSQFMMGTLLGFMPCGLVIAALMAAAAAGSAPGAMLAMASFGAGTLPALWLTAAGGEAVRAKWPGRVPVFKAGFALFSGISLLVIAGNLVF